MRALNICDIAVFETGLLEKIHTNISAIPNRTQDFRPMKTKTPDVAFVTYSFYEGNKVVSKTTC